MALTDAQLERYARHLILKQIGVKGQKALLAGKVLVIGAGGLGSPVLSYLAARTCSARSSTRPTRSGSRRWSARNVVFRR